MPGDRSVPCHLATAPGPPPREAPVPPAHSCNRFPKNLLTGSFRGGICSGEAPGNLNPADLWHGTRLAHGAGGPARASSPLGTHGTRLGHFGSPAWLWGGSTWIHHNPDSFGPRLRFQGGIFVSFWPPLGSPGPAAQRRGRTGAPRDRQRAGWGHVPTAEPGGVPRPGGRLQIFGTIIRGNIGARSPGVHCAGGTLIGAGCDGVQLLLKHRLALPPLIRSCCYLLARSTASLSRRFNYLPGCSSILVLGLSPAGFRGSAWHRGA